MKKDIKSKITSYKVEVYGGITRYFTNMNDNPKEDILNNILTEAFKSNSWVGDHSIQKVRLGLLFVEEKALNLRDYNVEGFMRDSQKWEVVGVCRVRKV